MESHTENHTQAIHSNKVKRTYRLDADLLDKLGEYASEHGLTVTAAIEQAIREAIREPYASHTDNDVLDVLREQLALKDAQISALNAALAKEQEIAQAAQLLHAASGKGDKALPDTSDEWKNKPLLDRLFKR